MFVQFKVFIQVNYKYVKLNTFIYMSKKLNGLYNNS